MESPAPGRTSFATMRGCAAFRQRTIRLGVVTVDNPDLLKWCAPIAQLRRAWSCLAARRQPRQQWRQFDAATPLNFWDKTRGCWPRHRGRIRKIVRYWQLLICSDNPRAESVHQPS